MSQQPCTKSHYEVTHADLPLCCPMPNARLWDGHPRVYLPIETSGKTVCPYCGAKYVLVDFEQNPPKKMAETAAWPASDL